MMLKSVTIDFDTYIQELKNEHKKGHKEGLEEGGLILSKCLNFLQKLTEVKIHAPGSEGNFPFGSPNKELIPSFKDKKEIYDAAVQLSIELVKLSNKT